MLTIKAVSKSFDDLSVLDTIDLLVEKEEFVSIIGPSGCGKSTLLEIITGLIAPSSGEVYFNGENVTGKTNKLGYMPQKDVLFPWRTVLENVIIPQEIMGASKKDARKKARQLVEKFGLSGFEQYYPSALSGGMKQRANFLRTVLTEKPLLALDEPFGKLDALTKREMQKWLTSVRMETKQSFLLITHDIEEAVFLSDRIYVMSKRPGRIVNEIQVKEKHPRSNEFLLSKSFSEIKYELLSSLGI